MSKDCVVPPAADGEQKRLTIWTYVDEYSSMASTREDEYADIERYFTEWLPGVELKFKHGVAPTQLTNHPDIYIWDIGGLCYVDHSGDQRLSMCHFLVDQLDAMPNVLFIPWSSMTRDTMAYAITEFLPEFAAKPEEERSYPEAPVRPNLWCPAKTWKTEEELGLPDTVRAWAEKINAERKPYVPPGPVEFNDVVEEVLKDAKQLCEVWKAEGRTKQEITQELGELLGVVEPKEPPKT